jgi:acetyl/propionyl-CoA carboxylase alpha subunit
MISKVIIWERDQEEAIAKMQRALSDLLFLGVK